MTKVAVWCRHIDDDIIGIGAKIPWQVESDQKFFIRIVNNQNVVMGRLTYESLPNRTIPDCQIMILTANYKYKVSDKNNHFLVSNIRDLADFEDDLYIAGGAQIYKSFMCGSNQLRPDIVIDCVYKGQINDNLKGEKITITPCIEVLNKKYIKVAESEDFDNVVRSVYIKRGDFVDQAVLKSILTDIAQK